MSTRHPVPVWAHALAGSALMLAALGAQAQSNLGFLRDTPITYFTKADVASLTQTVIGLCDTGKDGASVTWNKQGRGTPIKAVLTPGTPASGQQGGSCRLITTRITAKGQSMTLKPVFCKNDAGQWQLQKR